MRRAFLWILLIGAVLVVLGVLWQAFSMAAYVRGAGNGALDAHKAVANVIWAGVVAVTVGAIVAWWGNARSVVLAVAFLLVAMAQVEALGDTEKSGGWVNGLHGLLALVILLAGVAYLGAASRALGLRGSDAKTRTP